MLDMQSWAWEVFRQVSKDRGEKYASGEQRQRTLQHGLTRGTTCFAFLETNWAISLNV